MYELFCRYLRIRDDLKLGTPNDYEPTDPIYLGF